MQDKEYLAAAARVVAQQLADNPIILSIPIDPDVADFMGAFQEDAIALADVVKLSVEELQLLFARALALVREQGIGMAVLKARSPSCGNRQTYSGEFSGRLVDGAGVTAAALQAAGVVVFNEYELEQAAAWLALQAD